MALTYMVNEIFGSPQGEGVRAGTWNIFVRFSKCNLECKLETYGFDCDTEFESGSRVTLEQLIDGVKAHDPFGCGWVVLTGGEPALQVNNELITALHDAGYKLAIETNGTVELPLGIEWITVSPKTAEHTLRQPAAHELKYVRAHGQAIPKPTIDARHHLLSPAWGNDTQKNLDWCLRLVRENPQWRLSMQQHKIWNVR